jgi:hypothetical protein
VVAAYGNRMRKLALFAAMMLAAAAGAGAQDARVGDFDPIQVPSGGRPLAIDRTEDIPRQLGVAIAHANCRVDDGVLKDKPVLIFRPADGYRVMAIVPCLAIVHYSRAFVFERSIQSEPSPMTFPVIAPSGGFSASDVPGLMSWNPETRTLTAWRGNDYCPARETRHTYRQASGELNGFALVKVEYRQTRCTVPEAEWRSVWEAVPWNPRP